MFAFTQASKVKKQLKNSDRLVPWANMYQHIKANPNGTLIVEQAQKDGILVWWTPDAVLNLGPCDPPTEEELDTLYLRLSTPHPFVLWCYREYTSPSSGRGFLTDPPFRYPNGFVDAAFFRERFPGNTVVMSVLLRIAEPRTGGNAASPRRSV